MPSIVSPRGFVSWIRWAIIVSTNDVPATRNGLFGLNFGASLGDFIDLDISDAVISPLLRIRP